MAFRKHKTEQMDHLNHQNWIQMKKLKLEQRGNINVESAKINYEAPNMEEGHNAVELSVQRYSIFSQQNLETGHFDVTFLFNEKELHAHSFILWPASEVFETMLFGAWAKKEPIPITGRSLDDFKEFLTFLYVGKCSITMENVMGIVDLAESYNVQLLKDKCDQFLTNVKPKTENAFKIYETLKLYSLQNALYNVYYFIVANSAFLLKSDSFLETTKDIVMDIVKMENLRIKEEELFDAVYKWAEHQHLKQQDEPKAMKDLLSDILPHIRFPIMNFDYLCNHIVPLGGHILSFKELSQILKDAGNFQKKILVQPLSKYLHTLRNSFNVVITDNQGNKAHTYIHDKNIMEKLTNLNQNLSYARRNSHYYYDNASKECFWDIFIPKWRLTSCKNKNILDLNTCKLYIIRNQQGKLCLKDFSRLGAIRKWNNSWRSINGFNNYYNDIIARVYPKSSNFVIGQGCTLKVDVSMNALQKNNNPSYHITQNFYKKRKAAPTENTDFLETYLANRLTGRDITKTEF